MKLLFSYYKYLTVLYFGFLLVICIPVTVFANKDNPVQLDSLMLFNDSTFSDEERFELSINLAEAFAQNNPTKSEIYLESALAIAKKLDDTLNTLIIIDKLAANSNKQCEYSKTDEYYKQALIYIDRDNKNQEATLFFNMADNYYDWSKYELSKEYFEKSLELFKTINNNHMIAKTNVGLSAIYSTFGDYEKSIQKLDIAQDLMEQDDNLSDIAGVILGKGVIFENWRKLDKALNQYETALQLFNDQKNIFQQINMLLHIGDIKLKQEKPEEALDYYNKALSLENKVTNMKLRSICFSNIGEAYYKLNDLESAIEFQKKALKLKYEVGDKKRIAISLISLGRIYLAQNELELSKSNLISCLDISREIKNKDTEIEALLLLSNIYEKLNDHKIAIRYLKEYLTIKDEVFNLNSQKLINEMSAKYNAERIEKENKILKQQESIMNLELDRQKDSIFIAILVIAFIIIIFIIIIVFLKIKHRQEKRTYTLSAKKNKEITLREEQLKSLNQELLRSREQYKSLVENATIGMYKTNREGKILYANNGLVKMLGYESINELRKINLNDQENRQSFIELIEEHQIITGREDTWLRKDGSLMYVNESAWLVSDTINNITFYEGMVEDITSRKLAEVELKKSERQLVEINNELHKKNLEIEKAQDSAIDSAMVQINQLSNLCDEIRAPLNSIIGFADLIAQKEHNQKSRLHLDSIKSSSRELTIVIERMLDLLKNYSGNYITGPKGVKDDKIHGQFDKEHDPIPITSDRLEIFDDFSSKKVNTNGIQVNPEIIFNADQETLNKYVEKFNTKWFKINEAPFVGRIEGFCLESIDFSIERKEKNIENFFNSFLFYTKNFDVENIERFSKITNELFNRNKLSWRT